MVKICSVETAPELETCYRHKPEHTVTYREPGIENRYDLRKLCYRGIRFSFLDREIRMEASSENGSIFGAYVLGLAFAFGWTPCIGPQLSSILSLAASEGSILRGTFLLGIYALGLGLPFLLSALFVNRLSGAFVWLKRYLSVIERIMGLLLWTVGLMMLSGGFIDFSFWLLKTFPYLAKLG